MRPVSPPAPWSERNPSLIKFALKDKKERNKQTKLAHKVQVVESGGQQYHWLIRV